MIYSYILSLILWAMKLVNQMTHMIHRQDKLGQVMRLITLLLLGSSDIATPKFVIWQLVATVYGVQSLGHGAVHSCCHLLHCRFAAKWQLARLLVSDGASYVLFVAVYAPVVNPLVLCSSCSLHSSSRCCKADLCWLIPAQARASIASQHLARVCWPSTTNAYHQCLVGGLLLVFLMLLHQSFLPSSNRCSLQQLRCPQLFFSNIRSDWHCCLLSCYCFQVTVISLIDAAPSPVFISQPVNTISPPSFCAVRFFLYHTPCR